MPSKLVARAFLVVSLTCAGGCASRSGSDDPDGDGGADGCGDAPSIALGQWVERSVSVPGGGSRSYYVRLPAAYDPDTRYPVVYQLHGCSDDAARQNNNVPVESVAGDDAIHVRGRAADMCWSNAEDGPDLPYFDAVVEAVDSGLCTDADRRFLAGYSSGAFFAHRLACIRGDLVRAVATIAGGIAPGGDCVGDVGVLQIHDVDDETVLIENAGYPTRDGWLAANGCDTGNSATEYPPCVQYAGCGADTPVVFCETAGQLHGRQDAFAAEVFWDFLASFP